MLCPEFSSICFQIVTVEIKEKADIWSHLILQVSGIWAYGLDLKPHIGAIQKQD